MLRSIGSLAKDIIKTKIDSANAGSTFYLNFKGIELTDVSFVDEAILGLQKEIGAGLYGNRRIVLINLDEGVKENLEAAIYYREEKYNERVPVLFLMSEEITVLGNLEKSLFDTFNLIKDRRTLSARDLAEEKQIEINSASNRLKKLYDYGLVIREEIIDSDGRQHLYSIPV
ncbi:MAG: hypothetical protein VR67_05495 [Peptococcaceae bacterium BRH_c8a]|nr:MAG: hypothetical protein VR67_05495 [Peptococcaceae bacterium BRH_c8a]